MRAEGVGEGRSRPDFVADVGEQRLEQGIPHPLEHDVEGLEEGKAGAEEGGELLVEERELGEGDPFPTLEE